MIIEDRRLPDLAEDAENQRLLVADAFNEALDILGQPSKNALLFHLQEHSISLDNDDKSGGSFTLEQLYSALQTTLGTGGADLIMESVRLKMDELANKSKIGRTQGS
jgi:hypothetical protein